MDDAEPEWLNPRRAAAKLKGVHPVTVSAWADEGLLKQSRTAGGHRRVSAESVRELAEILDMPDREAQKAAKEALRRRNLGLPPDDGPGAPGQAAEPVEGE